MPDYVVTDKRMSIHTPDNIYYPGDPIPVEEVEKWMVKAGWVAEQ